MKIPLAFLPFGPITLLIDMEPEISHPLFLEDSFSCFLLLSLGGPVLGLQKKWFEQETTRKPMGFFPYRSCQRWRQRSPKALLRRALVGWQCA